MRTARSEISDFGFRPLPHVVGNAHQHHLPCQLVVLSRRYSWPHRCAILRSSTLVVRRYSAQQSSFAEYLRSSFVLQPKFCVVSSGGHPEATSSPEQTFPGKDLRHQVWAWVATSNFGRLRCRAQPPSHQSWGHLDAQYSSSSPYSPSSLFVMKWTHLGGALW